VHEVVLTAGLVFLRLAGMIAGLPIFSAEGTPPHAIILAGVGTTAVIAPTLPIVVLPTTLSGLISAVVLELLCGAMLSLGVRAAFAAITLAGELMALQSGLAMASLFDPLQRTQSSAFGTLSAWLSGMVFLGAGMHLRALEIVGRSFDTSPPGSLSIAPETLPALVAAVGAHLSLGVQLAGPLLALVFLVNVLVAILARLAPRMNVFFSIGMTITTIAGIGLLWFTLPWLLSVHGGALDAAVSGIARLLEP